jgi:enolase
MKSQNIKSIKAREVLNSKNNPTVEVALETNCGIFISSCPSGTSTGKYEAVEIKDADGGVKKAIENIEKKIGPVIEKEDLTDQSKIDRILCQLDGTENKSNLGVNAILPVSMAICRAGAVQLGLPLYKHINNIWGQSKFFNKESRLLLPFPSFNILNGGLHSKGGIDFQEFMVVPLSEDWQREDKDFFKKSLQIGKEIYQELKKNTKEKYGDFEIGAEGGVAPCLTKPEEALDLILAAAKNLGYEKDLAISLDVAASSFYKDGIYKTKMGDFTDDKLLDYYFLLTQKYPIKSIEDPFAEDDWIGFQKITKKIKEMGKDKFNIVGDDFLVTNSKRIKWAQEKKACNALLLKLNQIGTVSEGIKAALTAKKDNWQIMVSHRSGETEDDFIADFAVGIQAEFIKSGAPFPKERMAKYDRLCKIEKEVNL